MKMGVKLLRRTALLIFVCMLLASTVILAQTGGPGAPSANSRPVGIKKINNNQESDFWNVVKNRRSVRKFKSDPVPEAQIRQIIDAARMAPTSGNQQPWKFLVIRDRKVIDQMMEGCIRGIMSRYEADPKNPETKEQYAEKVRKSLSSGYFSAPVFIVILTDNNSKYPDYNQWDGPLAAGYLMLAARALGYGTVFITDAIPESVTKETLQIPDSYTRVCITPLGVPAEWPATPPKKNLEEMIAFDKL
jgi:nitroreductase